MRGENKPEPDKDEKSKWFYVNKKREAENE